jgi:hypothetical protein
MVPNVWELILKENKIISHEVYREYYEGFEMIALMLKVVPNPSAGLRINAARSLSPGHNARNV